MWTIKERNRVIMAGYYVVVMEGMHKGRFETADQADDYIEHHMRMFPGTPVPERVFVGVC